MRGNSIRPNRAGQVLRAWIKRSGMSRLQFADAAGISVDMLHKLIAGHRNWTWPTAKKVETGSGGALAAEVMMRLSDQPPVDGKVV